MRSKQLYCLFTLVLASIILTGPTHARASAPLIIEPGACDIHLLGRKLKREETFSIVYMAVDAGTNKKIVSSVGDGRREVLKALGASGELYEWHGMYLEPGVSEADRFYFGRLTRGFGATGFSLFPLHDSRIRILTDSAFEMTWSTYRDSNTVTEQEIRDFSQTEASLDPRRKITFTTETKKRQVISVVRLYDGSADPTFYLGHSREFDPNQKPSGDYQLPLERRYPHLNFREANHYVYEPGRQANSSYIEDSFTHQLGSIADFFVSKFGTARLAPDDFREGRVYVELTGKHIKSYLAPRSRGGLGFVLFAMTKDGRMERVPDNFDFSTLKIDRRETGTKYIAYKKIFDFVTDFVPLIQTPHF